MLLLLPPGIPDRLRRELRRARRREIGGLLLGEHVAGETFRIVDITVQRSGGSEVHFVRDPAQHRAQLDGFFQQTGKNYERFNYLGEWHSHPSFEPLPSGLDIQSMQSIVEDQRVGVNFLVLLIVRLNRGRIALSALMFRSGIEPTPVDVQAEEESARQHGWVRGVLRFL